MAAGDKKISAVTAIAAGAAGDRIPAYDASAVATGYFTLTVLSTFMFEGAVPIGGKLTLTDGGVVTQLTSKSTAVTLNTNSGQITMHAAALAAAAEVSFIVANSVLAALDVVVAVHGSGGTIGAYTVEVHTVTAGSFRIMISNVTAGSLSEAIVINFVVIGGASS